jgi:hypothetical protein
MIYAHSRLGLNCFTETPVIPLSPLTQTHVVGLFIKNKKSADMFVKSKITLVRSYDPVSRVKAVFRQDRRFKR